MCAGGVESELLHTYSQAGTLDVLLLCVRVAVLVAVTLTVPVVLFPVRHYHHEHCLLGYTTYLTYMSRLR